MRAGNHTATLTPIPPFKITHLRGDLYANESMAKHTSWRVGGPADWFYQPADLADLIQFMQTLPTNLPVFWLGLGSNVLVRDGGIRGIVIHTSGRLNEIKSIEPHRLRVEAGVSCAKIARFAAKLQLGGAEFLAGIPGTMGGALAMNAGAWGGETWQLVESVESLERNGQLHQRWPTDYEIGYRRVRGRENEWFISAILNLNPAADVSSQQRIKELLHQRNQSQPIGQASCGSVFQNPPNDYAARLIDQQGWKGICIGEACVSEKHANFIINTGHATARDIETLINQIKTSIATHTGIHLHCEVKIIGEP